MNEKVYIGEETKIQESTYLLQIGRCNELVGLIRSKVDILIDDQQPEGDVSPIAPTRTELERKLNNLQYDLEVLLGDIVY